MRALFACPQLFSFESPNLTGHRPGECSFLMPEKFTIDQRVGNRTTINLDKRTFPAG